MRRDQLEHAIRAACQIIGRPEVIIVGSQAILGTYPESALPAVVTVSLEVDVLPIAETNEETARVVEVPVIDDRLDLLPDRYAAAASQARAWLAAI